MFMQPSYVLSLLIVTYSVIALDFEDVLGQSQFHLDNGSSPRFRNMDARRRFHHLMLDSAVEDAYQSLLTIRQLSEKTTATDQEDMITDVISALAGEWIDSYASYARKQLGFSVVDVDSDVLREHLWSANNAERNLVRMGSATVANWNLLADEDVRLFTRLHLTPFLGVLAEYYLGVDEPLGKDSDRSAGIVNDQWVEDKAKALLRDIETEAVNGLWNLCLSTHAKLLNINPISLSQSDEDNSRYANEFLHRVEEILLNTFTVRLRERERMLENLVFGDVPEPDPGYDSASNSRESSELDLLDVGRADSHVRTPEMTDRDAGAGSLQRDVSRLAHTLWRLVLMDELGQMSRVKFRTYVITGVRSVEADICKYILHLTDDKIHKLIPHM